MCAVFGGVFEARGLLLLHVLPLHSSPECDTIWLHIHYVQQWMRHYVQLCDATCDMLTCLVVVCNTIVCVCLQDAKFVGGLMKVCDPFVPARPPYHVDFQWLAVGIHVWRQLLHTLLAHPACTPSMHAVLDVASRECAEYQTTQHPTIMDLYLVLHRLRCVPAMTTCCGAGFAATRNHFTMT